MTFSSKLTSTNALKSANFPPDGLMGMGIQSISDYSASPVSQTPFNRGKASSPVFSMKLTTICSELTVAG
jgi:cathepsin D